MDKKGKVVSLPTKQSGGVIQLVETEAKLAAKTLYQVSAWLDVLTQHNPQVSESVHRWVTKNKAAIKRVLKEHEDTANAQIKEEFSSYYPDENKGEEVYIQAGHPEIRQDQNGKVLSIVAVVDGVQVPDKAVLKTFSNGSRWFVSLYNGNLFPQEAASNLRRELKDETLRPEYDTKFYDATEKLRDKEYDLKIYSLPSEFSQGLHYPTVFANHSEIDPIFVEDVIYKYLISE